MPGLTFSNELISRDEGMHTEFAVLLYSMIENKLPYDIITSMFEEAVEIEKEFITKSIPCNLIGMNSELMCQYIEFVADRLIVQLGYEKIWNTANPFTFMELISLRPRVISLKFVLVNIKRQELERKKKKLNLDLPKIFKLI